MMHLLVFLAAIPLPGVNIVISPPNPQVTVRTDAQGLYFLKVDQPWTGKITPSFPGCAFTPPSISSQAVSDTFTFSFHCTDIQEPTMTVKYPVKNATIPRTFVTLAATATDNIGVVSVDWYLDGSKIGSGATLLWNAATVNGKGWHQMSATSKDAAGNATSSANKFRVQ